MLKMCILLSMVGCFACDNVHYRSVSDRWALVDSTVSNSLQTHLHEIDQNKSALHGKEVSLRGKLVYEFDDVAIYPLNEQMELKPVWIHIERDEKDLHDFLLKNDNSLVTVVGILDTTDLYDGQQYSSAIKDITSVDVTHSIAKR